MKHHKKGLALWLAVIVLLLVGALLAGASRSGDSGGIVSPGLLLAFTITAVLLAGALCVRLFVLPRFGYAPGRFQLLLEGMADWYDKVRSIAGAWGRFFRKAGGFLRQNWRALLVWLAVVLALLAGALAAGSHGRAESIQQAMRDAVLHDMNQIGFLGLKAVNPGLISAFVVTGVLLLLALCVRLFAIPRFRYNPGKLQMVLEEAVGLFDKMARDSSPHRNGFLGAYIFAAGAYIFVGTLFELLGVQAITVHGHAITLPAPLSDVNAAIALGCLSYLVILSGGVAGNGVKGVGKTLKEFSLPISMSFRLFGALLSGLLVTELVYYFVNLSFVLPVVVGVLFTLLHALIQTYVLTMLTSMYYGEVSERPHVHQN